MNFGPSFPTELAAAGLQGLPFSWTPDGVINGRQNLTAQQNTTLDNVIAAHNPNTIPASISRRDSFDADANETDIRQRILTATPAQIDTWLTNNVTTLAQARVVLGSIVKYLARNTS